MNTVFNTHIGVIVARLQVPALHAGHRHLIEEVRARHKNVIIIIGTPRTYLVDRYALGFQEVAAMVKESYPDVKVIPKCDERTPEYWSVKLDELFEKEGYQNCILYGSRDSFIPKYSGKHVTQVVEPISAPSGSDIRAKLSSMSFAPEYREAFRAGMIAAVQSVNGLVFPTVDIALFNKEKTKVLLVRKPGEVAWRFPGGFVDPEDTSMLHAAVRETKEETTLTDIMSWRIIGTHRVDDWRYRNTKHRIMTTLFTGVLISGKATPRDDVAEVAWVDIDDAHHWLTPEHRTLWSMLK